MLLLFVTITMFVISMDIIFIARPKSDYSTIILPGFDIPKIRGAINPNKMAIVINDKKHVRSTLNKFRERLIAFFSLVDVDDDIVWENNRNKFLESVQTS